MQIKKIIIGIDIGGTNTTLGFILKNEKIIERRKIRTTQYPDYRDFVQKIAEMIKAFLTNHTEHEIDGIGIGAPNGNAHNGTIEDAPNLAWKGTIELVKELKNYFNCPIKLTNDANAAALGEKFFGKAKDVRDYIFITLGTGLGSGFVANGNLICGHDGMAGELGHVTVIENGRTCGCGRKGCLETYVSAKGLVKTAREMISGKEIKTSLENNDRLNSELIFEAALKNDELALEAFRLTARILGQALANAIAITSPGVIYLFGGLAGSGKILIEPLQYYLNEYLYPVYKNKVRVELSGLPDADAAILGAASLIREHI